MQKILTAARAKRNISRNLRLRMGLMGMRNSDLARATKESRSRIGHYVSGRNIPGAVVLRNIAVALGVKVDDLLK